jgi:hypothetical protein
MPAACGPIAQQGGAGSHSEPSGGLIPEAGVLLALGLGELRKSGLPERFGPAALQHVHDRRQQPPPGRRPIPRHPDGGRLDSFESFAIVIQFAKLDRPLIQRPGYQQPGPRETGPDDHLIHTP